ncbi:MAG TPA: hypothetical protein ENN32_04580 [Chloroflexi bacterium]|nr:hypothetical protein [Chloroflexota bacterium]
MDYENTFTPNELKLVAFAPAVAANGIAMIDGMISEDETLTISANLLNTTEKYKHNDLIMLAIRSFSNLMQDGDMPGEMRYIRTPEEYMRCFRKVGKIIDKKVPDEQGSEYKQFLLDLMHNVAAASSNKRHSFFGNSNNVSAEEKDFIDHIAQIMNAR